MTICIIGPKECWAVAYWLMVKQMRGTACTASTITDH